jgi:hypothetical protein
LPDTPPTLLLHTGPFCSFASITAGAPCAFHCPLILASG